MTVSFTSTYRVPFKQPKTGVSPAQKDALKNLALQYGGIAPKYREGNVKFSVRKKLDEAVQKQLKKLGFNDYKMVDIHNVPNNQMVDALEYKGRFEKLDPKKQK